MMKSNNIYILLFFSFLFGFVPIYGQSTFPYFNTGQTADGFKILAGSTANLITFTENGIKLIDNTDQYAGVTLDGLEFSTEKGFVLEFEYGMDRGVEHSSKYGDGIAMVLYDGKAVDVKMGDKGGALGYAHTKGSNKKAGFTSGFLGLGLDLYGNYPNIMKSSNEIRNGLLVDNSRGNYVVLRGPSNPGDVYGGYPVLFAINTMANYNYYLNRNSGAVVNRQKGFEGQRFSLRGGQANVGVGDIAFRKVIISLVPGMDDVSSEAGFFVSVDVEHHIYKSSVIKNYFIPQQGIIRYREQISTSDYKDTNLNIEIPAVLKMAFTGSTGGAAIRAHIRNIALSLPFSPIANDMSIQQVLVDRESVFKPLYSAYGYKSNVYSALNPPTKSMLYLDKSSFRFKRMDPVTKQLVLTPDPYVLNEPNVGVFNYDVNSGEVTFTPVEGLDGTEPYTFYYDIKNQQTTGGVNLGDDEYRSRTAAVTLNFIKPGEGIDQFYPQLIINKGLKNVKDPKTVK